MTVRDWSAQGSVIRQHQHVNLEITLERERYVVLVTKGEKLVEKLIDYSITLKPELFSIRGTSWNKRRGSSVYPKLELVIRPNLHDELAKILTVSEPTEA